MLNFFISTINRNIAINMGITKTSDYSKQVIALADITKALGHPARIAIIEYLLKVNQDFLNHDYYTDIITFDYCENGKISGDLLISLDRVLDNSTKEKTIFEEELYRVIFHGVLHLCGFKDKSKKDIEMMRFKEAHYLNLYVPRETLGELIN